MYKFYYDHVCNKYDAKLLFTDTDSLIYEINREDVYEQCLKDRGLFDFSGYPIDSFHLAYNVVGTSHLGLIQVGTSRATLRRHHDVAIGT